MSKFLYFSTPAGEAADITRVTSIKAIETFIEELERLNLGPSGISSKINVLCFAQKFILHE